MIRWLLILALVLALGAAVEGPPSVPASTERAHLIDLLEHVCHRTAELPDELERCQYAGLQAVNRMAIVGEGEP